MDARDCELTDFMKCKWKRKDLVPGGRCGGGVKSEEWLCAGGLADGRKGGRENVQDFLQLVASITLEVVAERR